MKFIIKRVILAGLVIFGLLSTTAHATLMTQDISLNGAVIGGLQYDAANSQLASGLVFASDDPWFSLEFTIDGIFQDESYDSFGLPSFTFDVADLMAGVIGINFESPDFAIFATDVLDANFDFVGSLSFGSPTLVDVVSEPYIFSIFLLGLVAVFNRRYSIK
ncbi:hypothetical protein [Paraglaciecola arctica]|uniref:hypothetical protein n=1 Tax=Paraglaciecola arctica TaxID=1128911 RepID=UPI001C07445B|nr:hypothetical protein [Paraglaciecola arctica]MBU3005565.1 hypothetical protein [Paraglaciecola arctica]